jgi:glycosyltransferase involved in cell wall biosynthesis
MLGISVPIFYTPHAYYRMHSADGLKARFFHLVERLLGRIGTTVNMSRCERDFAQQRLQLPPHRQVIIANGADCARFRPVDATEKRRLREQFGLPPDGIILGTVGRLSLQKDPLTLYEAFARIAADFPTAFLAHLGQGELAPQVDALISKHALANRVKRLTYMLDTSSFYQALDGFVLTSLYEGMSYAVLEALAVNLPMVLTRAPGNESFEDSQLSHLWWGTPGDVRSVSDALARCLRSISGDMPVPNHREIAEREFAEEICYSRTLTAYQAA